MAFPVVALNPEGSRLLSLHSTLSTSLRARTGGTPPAPGRSRHHRRVYEEDMSPRRDPYTRGGWEGWRGTRWTTAGYRSSRADNIRISRENSRASRGKRGQTCRDWESEIVIIRRVWTCTMSPVCGRRVRGTRTVRFGKIERVVDR